MAARLQLKRWGGGTKSRRKAYARDKRRAAATREVRACCIFVAISNLTAQREGLVMRVLRELAVTGRMPSARLALHGVVSLGCPLQGLLRLAHNLSRYTSLCDDE